MHTPDQLSGTAEPSIKQKTEKYAKNIGTVKIPMKRN